MAEPIRVRVTTFRYAFGWVLIVLAGVTGVAIPLFAMSTGDTSEILRAASIAAPLGLGLAGVLALFTCRYARFDPEARELRLSRQEPIPWTRLRALWIVAGPAQGSQPSPTRSLVVVTDEAGAPWLEAIASAVADLEKDETVTELPASPYLKRDGVLDSLRSPTPGALIILIDSAPTRRAEAAAKELAALVDLPVLDMGVPKSPRFRRFRSA